MGRRKIEIEPLTDERNRTVTFVKRKAGLFKKAHELSVLCQVDLAVIIIGNNNKIYEFSSVDTNDLISNYQKFGKSKKNPHESKSHEDYSNYKKKLKISDPLTTKDGNIIHNNLNPMNNNNIPPNSNTNIQNDHDLITDDLESEYDSDSPQPKKKLKSLKTNNEKVIPNQRPILRVQIPKDSKNAQDSSKTLTALESGIGPGPGSGPGPGPVSSVLDHPIIPKDPPALNNNISLPRYPNYTSYRSPDSRKPPVLLPIHAKSQSSSPTDGAGPQLPFVAANNYFNNISQSSPNSNFPNILPTPILNQVLNSSFDSNNNPNNNPNNSNGTINNSNINNNNNDNNNNNSNSNNSNNTNSNTNSNNNTANSTTNPITSSNASSSNSSNSNAIDRNRLNPKFRPPLITNFNNENSNNNQSNTEQTPFSSLRNVYEMFPSPPTFYNPQDWPQGHTGMTPIHSSASNYFMNILPSASGGPGIGVGVGAGSGQGGIPGGGVRGMPGGGHVASGGNGPSNGAPSQSNNGNQTNSF